MRKQILIIILILFINACGGAPSMPPPAPISQVNFLRAIVAGSPVAIAVDEKGWIYATQEDGTIRVFSGDGSPVTTLIATDLNDQKILDQPSDLAISNKKIYVTERAIPGVVILSLSGKYLERFGSSGSDFKEFKKPSGIHIHDGVIYVADYGNDRIQVFGPNGVFLESMTGPEAEETPEHMIKEPIDVAVDYRGYVYVTCAAPPRTTIFLPGGDVYRELSDGGNPGAIAVGRDGFYVADQDSISIGKYDFEGNRLFSFGSKGHGKTQFGSISGLCVDAEDRVYVADRERGLIHVFSTQRGMEFSHWQETPPPAAIEWLTDIGVTAGKSVWAGHDTLFAVDGKNEVILKIIESQVREIIPVEDCTPISIALDKAGTLWVLDGRKKRVLRTDNKGRIRFEFGSSGRMAGQFSEPSDITITSMGVIYVSDLENKWVQAFNSDGLLLNVFKECKGGATFLNPCSIALDKYDTLYVLDSEKGTVTAFSSEGKLVSEFGKKGNGKGEFNEPVSLFATAYEVYVLDAGSCSIKVFSLEGDFLREFGTKGEGKGDFRKPSAISAKDHKTFFVSDSGNKRIQVLSNIYSPSPPNEIVAQGMMHAIRLSWRINPDPSVSSYRVYRSESPDGPFTKIVDTSMKEYNDRDVELNKTYYYLVATVAHTGEEGGKSNMARAMPITYTASVPSGLKATAGVCAVDLRWEPCKESFVIGYVVLREKDGEPIIMGTTESPQFSENRLRPDTTYTFMVAAVSSDGQRSDPASITITTKVSDRPLFEIEILEMRDVFSSMLKFYETEGIGRIRLVNNTCGAISDIRVSFAVNEFMDFPWELEIDELPTDIERDVVLKAVFNNKILNITEGIQVEAEIGVSYYEGEKPKRHNRTHTVRIFEKHRLNWNEKGCLAAFITPEDPLLLTFVRSVMIQYGKAYDNIQLAAAVFDALGIQGVTYMRDKRNPSTIKSSIAEAFNYIQYPRETLYEKSGGCEDMVALYAAALESIGVPTLITGERGHMLLMFSSGIMDDGSGDTMDGMFVPHQGILWVPVEAKLVGHSFIRAWEEGRRIYDALPKNGLSLVDVHDSWNTFEPVSLPDSVWEPDQIRSQTIKESYHGELKMLRKLVIQFRGRKYLDILAKKPEDINALMQIAIIKARAGEIQEAFKTFVRLIGIDPKNAGAMNNIGNIHFLEGRYGDARQAYKTAADMEPQDALIWLNLARCCQWLDLSSEAKDCFKKARALDPSVSKRFPTLANELLGTF